MNRYIKRVVVKIDNRKARGNYNSKQGKKQGRGGTSLSLYVEVETGIYFETYTQIIFGVSIP